MSDDKLREAVQNFLLELEERILTVDEMRKEAKKAKLELAYSFDSGMLAELKNAHSRLSTLLEK